jgi:hypothetical protein
MFFICSKRKRKKSLRGEESLAPRTRVHQPLGRLPIPAVRHDR